MAEQQWEYCQLSVYDRNEHSGLFGGKKGRSYDCRVHYFGPAGIKHNQLTELGKLVFSPPVNPFSEAMGLMGAASWELVSVQHGNVVTEYTGQGIRGEIVHYSIVAYFKRPVQPGRAVDEPKLVLGEGV